MTVERRTPIHPGEALVVEFMRPLGVSPGELAEATGIPTRHINAITQGREPVTADDAWRIGCALGTGAKPWMDLQTEFEMGTAHAAHASTYAGIRPLPV
ncbi:transcriptional regulator [Paraoerskovia sediminicola]|uniref:Transcriptional regulator n=1 Tax=Paraoerskovia sediminicola TaxID=1138587 RepID=A0ABM8G2Q2_9CELL|nr:HigA family addiction module antitoxin [Paraoerskovia sediminicola]BDZ42362.1 transcriptional regulator [Paraoerskovia sediminicola]